MKILFVSHNPLTRTLGASKHLLELADALGRCGWRCDFLQPSDLGMAAAVVDRDAFSGRLRDRLRECAGDYDAVDYDYKMLPFPRADFADRPLMVARSVLLELHMDRLAMPRPMNPRKILGRLLYGRRRRAEFARDVEAGLRTLREADAINVNNAYDVDELARRGVDRARVSVHPCGLDEALRPLFDAVPDEPPGRPVVAFVGSFDYRKGALDFPRLVDRVRRSVPDARFRLLGTAGLFPAEREVLEMFPRRLRPAVEVRPKFRPEELPGLLTGCSAGVFPSYLEGFGLGVLEMLAAAVPVVAYDVPGPPMMLPPERLVAAGDVDAMADRIVALLTADRASLHPARRAARESSRPFTWDRIARATADDYEARIAARRAAGSAPGGG